MSDPKLSELLVSHRDDLSRFVARHAGRILRFESADDLVQGIHVRALARATEFRYRGREPFCAWMYTIARSHIADRHAYWAALRRRPARLVRLGTASGTGATGVGEPAATSTSPSAFASRREQLDLALRALALLLPRDRDLVRWTCEDVDVATQAERLGITLDAADRARRRAVERFRKAFELASKR